MESIAEVWRPVKVEGYEDCYEVSNLGQVRSVDRICEQGTRWGGTCKHRLLGRILSQRTQNSGYQVVTLSVGGVQETFLVHVLVALAFIGPCPEGHEVDHKDRVKPHNYATNLQYKTHQKNIDRAANDDRGFNKGETNGCATLTNAQVLGIAEDLKTMGVTDVAKKHGLLVSHVSRINTGAKWWRITGAVRGGSITPIRGVRKSKILPAQVVEMRQMKANGMKTKDIAAAVGRPIGTVEKIVNRERRANVA